MSKSLRPVLFIKEDVNPEQDYIYEVPENCLYAEATYIGASVDSTGKVLITTGDLDSDGVTVLPNRRSVRLPTQDVSEIQVRTDVNVVALEVVNIVFYS